MNEDPNRTERLIFENRDAIKSLRRRIEAQRFILIALVRSIERSAGIDPEHFIVELREIEETWRQMNEPGEMIEEVRLLAENLIPRRPARST